MNTIGGRLWELDLASGWEASSNEDCVSITNPDGYGALQISAYQGPDDSSIEDFIPLEELSQNQRKHLGMQEWGEFHGYQLIHAQSDNFWRKWWLGKGSTYLFVTYNCDRVDQDIEVQFVNSMLHSLRVRLAA